MSYDDGDLLVKARVALAAAGKAETFRTRQIHLAMARNYFEALVKAGAEFRLLLVATEKEFERVATMEQAQLALDGTAEAK